MYYAVVFEEKKLAHDIYVEMYNFYGAYIFNNISESEQRHMDFVAKLISKYELDKSVVDNGFGAFTNKVIQDEYDRLLVKGNLSLTSALEVGVEIEIMDIDDIIRMLEETTSINGTTNYCRQTKPYEKCTNQDKEVRF